MPVAAVRARCPVMFVAYGEGGASWLSALRARCLEFETTRALVERAALQFWWIAGDEKAPEGVARWPHLPALSDLSDALSRARDSEFELLFPGFEQRRIIVAERASLFQNDLADLRRGLHTLLDQVPGSKAVAQNGQLYFEYQRVLLADALHDPAAVTNAQRLDARAVLSATGAEPCTAFLVDRENTRSAVVSPRLAEQSLCELAAAFVLSDLGAPIVEGAATPLPDSLKFPSAEVVIPFGVMAVEHRWRAIEEARARSFREQLAATIRNRTDTTGGTYPRLSLRTVVEQDISALDRESFDADERRRRRREEFRDFLVWAFSGGNGNTALDAITDARQAADRLMADGPAPASARLPQWGAMVAGLVTPVVAVTTEPTSDSSPLTLAVLAAAGLAIGGGFLWHRRRQQTEDAKDSSKHHGVIEAMALERASLRDEWRRSCDRLQEMVSAWEQLCRTASQPIPVAAGMTEQVWIVDPPMRFRLNSSLGVPDQVFGNPAALCRRLADSCVQQLDTPNTADQVLERAAKEAMRGMTSGGIDLSIAAEYLKEAVRHDDANNLRRAFNQASWLMNPTRPVERNAIIWLVHPSINGQGTFSPLETEAALPSILWCSHDDAECSIRMQIGTPIPFDAISSLLPQND